ncbi:MAG: SMEK domain-containing protein [Clostridia bacterium]|nr:SMEK domain-containing protein [Clostridia bacterium]
MKRGLYFNYIERQLSLLAFRIMSRGKINILDLNIYSETFFADMMNIIFSYNLRNLNTQIQNVDGIDLVDDINKIIMQVSSTVTKQKIENSLNKKKMNEYKDYHFRFVAITDDASKLRNITYKNPYNVEFNPKSDIIDNYFILKTINNMPIDRLINLYDFVKKELGNETDIVKIDSNLTTIINILNNEDLGNVIDAPVINAFEINKKIEFNQLDLVKDLIDDYKIYYSKLNEKYSEFDKAGVNKSLSVFRVIKKQYVELKSTVSNPHELFGNIIKNIIDIVIESKNYNEMPYEELEMCVCIIVVDAFVRCKIFENPEGYSYVTT